MFGYKEMLAEIDSLEKDGVKSFNIGNTLLGRQIKGLFKGSLDGAQLLIQASMHAREYITTPLVLQMLKSYTGKMGVWCVPMVNIDGVELCQRGLQSVDEEALRKFLLNVNGGSDNFELWKANARAVDLNVNWNANWGEGSKNIVTPAPENYIGKYPLSESENIALRDFTLRIQPDATLSYHTKGNVIFYGFGCLSPNMNGAEQISMSTGYPLLSSNDSAGGFKDWFVATTAKLGLTMEVGKDTLTYPISLDNLPSMYEDNKNVLSVMEEILSK